MKINIYLCIIEKYNLLITVTHVTIITIIGSKQKIIVDVYERPGIHNGSLNFTPLGTYYGKTAQGMAVCTICIDVMRLCEVPNKI